MANQSREENGFEVMCMWGVWVGDREGVESEGTGAVREYEVQEPEVEQ